MSTLLDRFLDALRAVGCEPKRQGDQYVCRCPAHDDHNPSLSIGVGADGRLLVHCFTGCPTEEVAGAVGWTLRDLMGDSAGPSLTIPRTGASKRGSVNVNGVNDAPAPAPRPRYDSAREAVEALEAKFGPRCGMWTYTDAVGNPVGVVVRWDKRDPTDLNAKPKKRFLPVSKIDGRWEIAGMFEPRPLYRLPDLAALPRGSTVYVFEGEKCVEAARQLGLVATTSVHGSQSPKKTDWSPLAGTHVVIVLDNDEPGEGYGQDVAELALNAGAASVRIVRLPGLGAGEDIVEFIAKRHAEGKTDGQVAAEVVQLAAGAELVARPALLPATLLYRPFPVDALPEPLRTLVRVGAAAIGCDPAFIAMPVLVVAAGCIGNACRVQLKGGWTEPCVLWAAPVADSGSLKSPAYRLAVGPLRKIQTKWLKEYQLQVRAYAAEMVKYEQAVKDWKNKGCTGDPPLEPEKPVAKRIVVSDITVEALAPLLMDNPHGLICTRDELAGWIGCFDRYAAGGRGGDGPAWLSMYDADSLFVDRKSKLLEGPITVTSAAVSLIGTIQPGVLARVFSNQYRENGTLARVLLARPPSDPGLWTENEVPKQVEEIYTGLLEDLLALEMKKDEDDDEPRPRVIPLSPEGKAAFVVWHDQHAREMAALTGDLGAAFSKLKGICARIALVIHCVRVASNQVDHPGQIDAESVGAAIKITEWFKHEARRVYSMLDESDSDRERRQLVELIRRKGGSVTVRALMQSSSRLSKCTAKQVEKLLDDLKGAGLGRWDYAPTGKKGGKPSKRFTLIDSIDIDNMTLPMNGGHAESIRSSRPRTVRG